MTQKKKNPEAVKRAKEARKAQKKAERWFNLTAIRKEVGRVRWSKPSELWRNSVIVIIFTGFFMAYFVLADAAVSAFLKLINLGG